MHTASEDLVNDFTNATVQLAKVVGVNVKDASVGDTVGVSGRYTFFSNHTHLFFRFV